MGLSALPRQFFTSYADRGRGNGHFCLSPDGPWGGSACRRAVTFGPGPGLPCLCYNGPLLVRLNLLFLPYFFSTFSSLVTQEHIIQSSAASPARAAWFPCYCTVPSTITWPKCLITHFGEASLKICWKCQPLTSPTAFPEMCLNSGRGR